MTLRTGEMLYNSKKLSEHTRRLHCRTIIYRMKVRVTFIIMKMARGILLHSPLGSIKMKDLC
jgi:hypothetical protein